LKYIWLLKDCPPERMLKPDFATLWPSN